MTIEEFLASLEGSGLATAIRDSLYYFPLIESVHVVGLTLVFGMIAIVDLRLLGVASTNRAFSRITSDVMKLIWVAFAVAVVTGLLMFITNAAVYYSNFYFRLKMLMLALAGINMLVFDLTTGRAVRQWDRAPSAPRAGRIAAVLSLVLWGSVIFAGRWIGFTTSQSEVELPADINLDELFPPQPQEDSAPASDESVPPAGESAPPQPEGANPSQQ